MPSKKYWKKLSIDFLHEFKKTKTEEIVHIGKYSFVALPDVFSPVCSSDTRWFAEKIVPITQNLHFLEIGTGTGIIACLASLNGASKVVATDINPQAIKNTALNQKLLNLNFSIRTGSVFDPIKDDELFDIIFWNHPFNFTDDIANVNEALNLSVFDLNYESLKTFFRDGKKHLTPNGKLILGTSNIAKLQLIKQTAKNEGYEFTLLEKTIVPAYKDRKVKMDLRIYSFKTSTTNKQRIESYTPRR